MIETFITCTVVFSVYSDADTIRCANGQHVRLAGISALERSGRCNSTPDCPTMPPRRAKAIVDAMTVGRTFTFTVHGRSGKRIVGDNRSLRCAIVATGAAVTWRKYARRYGLRGCA